MEWVKMMEAPHASPKSGTNLRIHETTEAASYGHKEVFTLQLLTQDGWRDLQRSYYYVTPNSRENAVEARRHEHIKNLKDYAAYLYEGVKPTY